MKIPVHNLYFLLAYAWDRLPEAGIVDARASDYTHVLDLFGHVLSGCVEHLLKRGLDRGYVEVDEDRAGIRGKLCFGESLKRNLLTSGRATCTVDDLTIDVLHNRIIYQTLVNVLALHDLDPVVASRLAECRRRLSGITGVDLDPAAFARVQLHGNNAFYDFALRVCRLVHDCTAVDDRTGELRFRDFVEDDRKMAGLFERFILNFYRREQTAYSARSKHVDWQSTLGSEEHLAFLPSMKTDISLESAEREIVIDAKFYREPTQSNFGKDSVRSGHLYQLFAYLRNIGATAARPVEGVLLYPQTGDPIDLRYVVHGHPVRIKTLDLAGDWRNIHDELLALTGRPPAPTA